MDTFRRIGILLLITLGIVFGYTALHEGGHALAVLAFGGTVTDFNLDVFTMGAHVSMEGAFTAREAAVINLAGVSLPIIVWVVFMLILPRQASPLLQIVKGITSLGIVNTLLAWIILPLLYLNKCAPPGDDVTQFAANSGAPPLLITFLFLGLYVLGWAFILLRIDEPGEVLRIFINKKLPDVQVRHVMMVIALVSLGVVGSAMGMIACESASNVPTGYALQSSIALDKQNYINAPLTSFTLDEDASIGVIVIVNNVNTPYLEVALNGLDGSHFSLMHAEGFFTTQNISQGTYLLAKGTYQVTITSKISPGNLQIYLKLP